jgi:Gpi18-like mannosyltransferase
MQTVSATPVTPRFSLKTWLQEHREIVMILLLALFMRLVVMGFNGYPNDIVYLVDWGSRGADYGFGQIYTITKSDYPPIYLMYVTVVIQLQRALAVPFDGGFNMVVFKVVPTLCELILITIVYQWLSDKPRARRLISILLAIHPGMIATSAFWGQADSMFILFVTCVLIALNKRAPRWAWFWFACGMSVKLQTLAVVPVLFMLTWKRHGWREVLIGIGIVVAIVLPVLTPFIIDNGSVALHPYIGFGGRWPGMTHDAFNFWFLVHAVTDWTPSFKYSHPIITWLADYGYRPYGYIFLISITLLVCYKIWKKPDAPYEFIWGAMLYWGMFMLMGQMHDRYFYGGSVLMLIAYSQDRRLIVLALLGLFTYSHNVLWVTTPPFPYAGFIPLDYVLWFIHPLVVAVINLAGLVMFIRLFINPIPPRPAR